MTRNDIQVCIPCFMQWAILQSDEISVQFRLFVFILSWVQIWHFVFIVFFSWGWPVKTVFSQNTQKISPSISFPNKMYLAHYDRR